MQDIKKIINPLLMGKINEEDVDRIGQTTPKYSVGEIVDVSTWTGRKYGFKVVDVKVTYHNRMEEYVWGYKLFKEGESTGFSFSYIPEGYLLKRES